MTEPTMVVQLTTAELRDLILSAIAEVAEGANDAERLLDSTACAQLLDVSMPTLRKLVDAGMPHLMVGDVRRFERDVVLAWCREQATRKAAD